MSFLLVAVIRGVGEVVYVLALCAAVADPVGKACGAGRASGQQPKLE